jgi:proteasome assembly chaperone (PAC2) family protein
LRFSWSEVKTAKIYATITKNNLPSDSYYVCLDALRVENNTATNSLYGMTGYSVIKNVQSRPIIKSANTTNYIEFRFALDV